MSVDTMDTSEVISIVKKAKTDNERLASLLLVCATRRAVYWIDVFEVPLAVWRNTAPTAPTAPEEKLLQEKHKLTTATL